MPRATSIVPVTDFRQDAATIINRVAKSKEPLVITRRGRAAAVLKLSGSTTSLVV